MTKTRSEDCSVRKTQADIAGFEGTGKGRGRGTSPGMQVVWGSWKKQGNGFSPRAFRQEHRPADLLILAQLDPYWTSGLWKYEITD